MLSIGGSTEWSRKTKNSLRQIAICPRARGIRTEVVRHHNKTVPQVVFRFAVQLGMLPLTGTTDGTHMRHDLDIFDFTLTQHETKTMLALGESR